jgi:hypothetical protein
MELRMLDERVLHEPMRPFKITVPIEDETGAKKDVDVFFTTKSDLGEGVVGEVRSDGIFLRTRLPSVLVPILAQMFYFQSKGYSADATITAAVLYGRKVLDGPDLESLASLLGVQSTNIVLKSALDRDAEHYAVALSAYLHRYEHNPWIARARAFASISSIGDGCEALAGEMGGRVAMATKHILSEGSVHRRGEDGKPLQVAPSLR